MDGFRARIQSVTVVPLNRNGEAPSPFAPAMRGASDVLTPVVLCVILVCTGNRPDITVA